MKVLFLCSANVFRSQIAEAFFNKYSKKHKAKSAALIKPQDKMHKLVIRAMKEKEIDINKNISKKATLEIIEKADLIILMNPDLKKHFRNINKNKKIIIWNIPDLVAKETDEHLYPKIIEIRNLIEQKIKELINRIE